MIKSPGLASFMASLPLGIILVFDVYLRGLGELASLILLVGGLALSAIGFLYWCFRLMKNGIQWPWWDLALGLASTLFVAYYAYLVWILSSGFGPAVL